MAAKGREVKCAVGRSMIHWPHCAFQGERIVITQHRDNKCVQSFRGETRMEYTTRKIKAQGGFIWLNIGTGVGARGTF